MRIFCKYCEINCENLTLEGECSKMTQNNISNESQVFIPEGCEHYGQIFLKLEEIKQKVRRYKEEILYYESMVASGCKEEKVYSKIIVSLNRFIDKYSEFGARDW